MLDLYMNQTADLQRVLRDDEGNPQMDSRGQFQYDDTLTVACRKRAKIQEILTAQEQVVKAQWIYTLADAVAVDDLLDGMRVQLVTNKVTLGGEIIGYKAVV